MKKLSKYLILLCFAVSLSSPKTSAGGFDKDAQVEHIPGGKVIKFTGTLDTSETYTSKLFMLSDVDDAWSSGPPSIGAILSGDSVNMSCYLVATNFDGGTFANKDTLLSSADTSGTEINRTFDANGSERKFYRWALVVKGNPADANNKKNLNTFFEITLVFTNKDANKEDD